MSREMPSLDRPERHRAAVTVRHASTPIDDLGTSLSVELLPSSPLCFQVASAVLLERHDQPFGHRAILGPAFGPPGGLANLHDLPSDPQGFLNQLVNIEVEALHVCRGPHSKLGIIDLALELGRPRLASNASKKVCKGVR